MRVPLRKATETRHDLTGGAVAALETFMLDEGCLQRMEVIALLYPLDGRDFSAFMHDRERQTGIYPFAIHQHGAGTASTLVAALFGTGQLQYFSKDIEDRLTWVEFQALFLAVDD